MIQKQRVGGIDFSLLFGLSKDSLFWKKDGLNAGMEIAFGMIGCKTGRWLGSMFWKMAVVFGVFVVMDLLGHFGFQIKRVLLEWFLLAVMVISFFCFMGLALFNSFEKKEKSGENIYMAYRYLSEGKIEQAKTKLTDASVGYETQAKVLEMLCEIADRDFVQGYFISQRLLNDGILSIADRRFVQKAENYCKRELGLLDGSIRPEKTYHNYEEYREALSARDEEKDSETDENLPEDENSAWVRAMADEYIQNLKFKDEKIEEYKKCYELDLKLNAMDISNITEEELREIRDAFGDTPEVKKLECKFYVRERDYEQAKEKALELVKNDRSEENYIIYTDLIAQEIYEQEETDDMENVYRAINYLLAKRPLGDDITGIYDLQLAKLYLVAQDRDRARDYLYRVMEHGVEISDESPIREALDEVLFQYFRMSEDVFNGELKAAIVELVKKQSGGVVSMREGSINSSFVSYIMDCLVCDIINANNSETSLADGQKETEDGADWIGQSQEVFRSGRTKSIRIGDVTITADIIWQTGEKTLTASGNVLINGFIHCSGELVVEVPDLCCDLELTKAVTVYVGDGGTITGSDKLYVSHKQSASDREDQVDYKEVDAERNGENSLLSRGKDHIICRGDFTLRVTGEKAEFDMEPSKLALGLPETLEVNEAKLQLYRHRLQVEMKVVDFSKMAENIVNAYDRQNGTHYAVPKVLKEKTWNQFSVGRDSEGSLSLVITPDWMQFGGEVSLEDNDVLHLGSMEMKMLTVKMNSFDQNHVYWQIEGKIDFGHVVAFRIENSEYAGRITSDYWLPHRLNLDVPADQKVSRSFANQVWETGAAGVS